MSGVQVTPELLTAVAGVITAIGVAIKNARDNRRERRARRRELEQVARAAAKESPAVRQAVEDLESTGTFQRPGRLDQ